MAGYVGKLMTFKINMGTSGSPDWQKIGAIQTKGIKLTNGFVEITNDDSAYGVEYLAGSGVTAHELTAEGVAQDSAVWRALVNAANNRTAVAAQFFAPGAGTFQGDVLISDLNMTATTKAEVRYSLTVISAEGGLPFTGI